MTESGRLQFLNPQGTPDAIGYSQVAIAAPQRLAFISGQVGADENWNLSHGFEAQADRAFQNLQTAVEAAGGKLGDIAKLTIFVLDSRNLDVYCAVRDRYFRSLARAPASTYIEVSGLYTPAALIEIEAVVALG